MTHDDDTCPHLVRANLLEAENARLKAEVMGLTKELADAQESYHLINERTAIFIKENARLKAEVEELRVENESLQVKATNIYNAIVVRCNVQEITNKANADSIIAKGMMSEAMKLMEESMAIKAEVERLTADNDQLQNRCDFLESKQT
jgi:uncharacterized small protein (DUF1192 family)